MVADLWEVGEVGVAVEGVEDNLVDGVEHVVSGVSCDVGLEVLDV